MRIRIGAGLPLSLRLRLWGLLLRRERTIDNILNLEGESGSPDIQNVMLISLLNRGDIHVTIPLINVMGFCGLR